MEEQMILPGQRAILDRVEVRIEGNAIGPAPNSGFVAICPSA